MLIGIDIDDVLLHFTPALIEYHNHTYKTSLTYDQFKSPNFWEVWGGTKQESRKKVDDFFKTTYFRKMQPIVGAKEALFELRKKHNLVNITASPNYAFFLIQKEFLLPQRWVASFENRLF